MNVIVVFFLFLLFHFLVYDCLVLFNEVLNVGGFFILHFFWVELKQSFLVFLFHWILFQRAESFTHVGKSQGFIDSDRCQKEVVNLLKLDSEHILNFFQKHLIIIFNNFHFFTLTVLESLLVGVEGELDICAVLVEKQFQSLVLMFFVDGKAGHQAA